MSQRKYALELIVEMGLVAAKPTGTPLESNLKLTSTKFDNLIASDKHPVDYKELVDTGQYQRLIGRLLYLTMTRIDIVYAVQILIQFMHKPKQSYIYGCSITSSEIYQGCTWSWFVTTFHKL